MNKLQALEYVSELLAERQKKNFSEKRSQVINQILNMIDELDEQLEIEA